ncbi:MAG: SurA N-terminal domain-containing protein [Candidatus Binatia bacterium]|nr:SurA N-terminal domain-containing protein [Candidatus Binatia bacterium]
MVLHSLRRSGIDWAVVIGLALAACLAAGQEAGAPAAVVNGAPIPRKVVDQIVAGIVAVKGAGEGGAQREEWERSALESLIDFELLYQEARRVGVNVDSEEVEKEIERSRGKFGGEEKWQRALAERGWTLADLKRDTERAIVVQRFLETVVWKEVRVESHAVDDFYRRNQDEFRHPRQVRLKHAFVAVQSPTPEGWRAAERAAGVVRQKWLSGATNSVGPAEVKGVLEEELGWVGPGELDPEVERVVFDLATGEASKPVRHGNGVHVFLVEGKREAGIVPLEEARTKIEAVLRKRERQRLRDELVARLRQQADIRYP